MADTLGEIAGSVINNNADSWPQFKTNVWELFKQQNVNSNILAFLILESFFNYAAQHYKDDANNLFVLFKAGLNHENMKMRLGALKSFESYL